MSHFCLIWCLGDTMTETRQDLRSEIRNIRVHAGMGILNIGVHAGMGILNIGVHARMGILNIRLLFKLRTHKWYINKALYKCVSSS